MQTGMQRIEAYEVNGIPVPGGQSVEWRRQTGEFVGVTALAPHGRKGLWDAMTAAAEVRTLTYAEERAHDFALAIGPIRTAPVAEASVDEVIDLAGEEAALAYLAKATFVRAGETIKAKTPQSRTVGNVVDLDAFRARYRRS